MRIPTALGEVALVSRRKDQDSLRQCLCEHRHWQYSQGCASAAPCAAPRAVHGIIDRRRRRNLGGTEALRREVWIQRRPPRFALDE